ncbi:MAG: LPS export ABC transporter periplasmic protein LptC, partial [Flavobacteriales bacterium]|nr:LPS export ABC transporter periplasmic protein LptC [Flavobacteriales bacterium]
GTYYDTEGRLEARENVVFKNNEGATLKTEELIWLQDSDKVFTNKFVEITNDDGSIFSKGMTTNSKFSFYRLWEVNGDILLDQPEKEEKEEKNEP